MLGNAITTELQLLAVRDRLTDLAAAYRPSRASDSTREGDARTEREAEVPGCLDHGSLGRPASA